MFFNNISEPADAIILAYGMPGTPAHKDSLFVRRAVADGFIVFVPHYIGTFESYGSFDIKNAVQTITKTATFVSRGMSENRLKGSTVNWTARTITLVGWSFGGSIALVAGAKSKEVDNIIAVSAPTDYKTHAKTYSEENLDGLSKVMTLIYPNTWRIKCPEIWAEFLKGSLDLNAIDYVEQLNGKAVLLIHGLNDKTVNFRRSESLYEKLSKDKFYKKLLLVKGAGHMDIKSIGRKRIFYEISSFIKQGKSYDSNEKPE